MGKNKNRQEQFCDLPVLLYANNDVHEETSQKEESLKHHDEDEEDDAFGMLLSVNEGAINKIVTKEVTDTDKQRLGELQDFLEGFRDVKF